MDDPSATVDARTRLDRVGLWSAVGFGLYVVMGFGSILFVAAVEKQILAPFGLVAEAGAVGLSVRNGIWLAVWGVLVAGVAMWVGRLLVPGARFAPLGWTLLGVGIGLAALCEYEINEFVRGWAGVFDPEYANVGGFAPPALLAVALAGWAALAVPPPQRFIPTLLCIAAGVGASIALGSNLPGAIDGIRQVHSEIAVVFAISGLWILVIPALVIVQRRR